MKRKIVITLLAIAVLLVGLFACGKADDIEVVSNAIETPEPQQEVDDQQEVEEENTVDEVENVVEQEPEEEVMDVTAVEKYDTTSLGNGSGEQITTQEEDYFKEAEELWSIHETNLDTNWETFRETYTTERKDNDATKDEALATMLELFKKQEQPQQQQQQQQSSSSQQQSTQTQTQSQSQSQTSNNVDSVQQDNAALDALLGITSTHTHMDDIPRTEGFDNIDYSGLEGITAE